MKEGTDKMADLVTEQAIENSKQENIPPIKPGLFSGTTVRAVSMAYASTSFTTKIAFPLKR